MLPTPLPDESSPRRASRKDGAGAERLAAAKAALDKSPADHHLVVLKDDGVHTFRGLYALRREGGGPFGDAERIFGRGSVAARRKGQRRRSGPPLDARRGPKAGRVGARRGRPRRPARFGEAHVARFLKFNSSKRAFAPLPSRSFAATTDAAILVASLNPKNRPSL